LNNPQSTIHNPQDKVKLNKRTGLNNIVPTIPYILSRIKKTKILEKSKEQKMPLTPFNSSNPTAIGTTEVYEDENGIEIPVRDVELDERD
jgi:hypothetical protein